MGTDQLPRRRWLPWTVAAVAVVLVLAGGLFWSALTPGSMERTAAGVREGMTDEEVSALFDRAPVRSSSGYGEPDTVRLSTWEAADGAVIVLFDNDNKVSSSFFVPADDAPFLYKVRRTIRSWLGRSQPTP